MNQGNGALPLLDSEVLDRLLFELDGDEGLWTVFVRDYLIHLPNRIERIRLTLTSGDLVGAMDAVLSLKTSSQMVGAERLTGYAVTLERSLREHSSDAEPAMPLAALAVTTLRPLRGCAEQTAALLKSHLRRPNSPRE